MEKTLSMGAFTELDEREVMETEGGKISNETWGSWGYWEDVGSAVADATLDKKGKFSWDKTAYNFNVVGAVRNNIRTIYNNTIGSMPGYQHIWEIE